MRMWSDGALAIPKLSDSAKSIYSKIHEKQVLKTI